MPSVSVLYISDRWVGPHLELLRNICDPSSTSKPHVTVRYSDDIAFPPEDFRVSVPHVDFIAPRAFGLENPDKRKRFTIYIKADSDKLRSLEFKPDFPTSEFHVTVYNGPSKDFAVALLERLKAFNWRFRVKLPRQTRLSEIRIESKRSSLKEEERGYSSSVRMLFKRITGKRLSWEFVKDLSDEHRLDLVDEICRHLMVRITNIEDRYNEQIESIPRTVGEGPSTSTDLFLTPPELARELAEYALKLLPKKTPIHFGDPAVGTGAFFSALLDKLKRRELSSAIGIDIDSTHIDIAHKRWAQKGLETLNADFLHLDELSPRTLILANPPYLRHQKIGAKYKEQLRERSSVRTGMVVSGLSGLYVYFLLLCDAWMEKDGIAAWLIPSEFMQTDYGIAIKKYLTERVQLLRIHQYGFAPKFEGVLAHPAVVIFRKKLPSEAIRVCFSRGESLESPEFHEFLKLSDLRADDKWTIPHRPELESYDTDLRIGDLFDVRRGIATGANSYFIIEREKLDEMGIPERFVRPILPKIATLETDVVERRKDGYPKLNRLLCVLDIDVSEEEIRKTYPKLYEYLSTAQENGVRDRTLVRSRRLWYRQEFREPAPFLCTYMGRNSRHNSPIRFIWNKSDAIAANTYLMLYPKPPLLASLRDDPRRESQLFSILKDSAKETMKEQWRLHAGGLHKIEPSELMNVRLTSEPEWLAAALRMELR